MSLATTAVVWFTTFAAVAALGVAGAYWTWAWFAPRPEASSQALVPGVEHLDAAYRLFGTVRVNRSGAAPSSMAVKLLATVAASSGSEPGYAVLQLDAKRPIAVRQGDELEPGTRVVEVNTDHVVLDRGGIRETLAWPKRGAGKR